MDMFPVTSSNVDSVGYDEAKRVLHVTFHSGDTYEYENVPKNVFDGLLNADSVGRYFNANVKNVYSFTQV